MWQVQTEIYSKCKYKPDFGGTIFKKIGYKIVHKKYSYIVYILPSLIYVIQFSEVLVIVYFLLSSVKVEKLQF